MQLAPLPLTQKVSRVQKQQQQPPLTATGHGFHQRLRCSLSFLLPSPTFQISDPVCDSSITASRDLRSWEPLPPYHNGLRRCFLLTGPHTSAACLGWHTPSGVYGLSCPHHLQAANAAEASVPKLFWLSRCCLPLPLGWFWLVALRRPSKPTTSAARALFVVSRLDRSARAASFKTWWT